MTGRDNSNHEETIDKFVKKELSLNSVTNTLVDREMPLYELFLSKDSLAKLGL